MERQSTKTVRWWWVRHAPARLTDDAVSSFLGWSDPPADLSDEHALGVLRSALPEEAAILSSDLVRARETADAIARRNNKRLEPEPQLREQNFGAWEGRPYGAPEMAEFWRNPALAAPPEGESFAEVCDRVSRAVMTQNGEDETEIVAVAHAGSIRAALALALGLPPSQALTFEIAPLSLTRIDWLADARAWRIGGVNIGL